MNAFISTTRSPRLFSCGAHTARDPFFARHGRALPRLLQNEAAGMSWDEFLQTFAPSHGPVRLGGWSSTRLSAGRGAFEATIAVGDTIHTASATACGPIAAMTQMLFDLGLHLEIHSFHRYDLDGSSFTFLRCGNGERSTWAMGVGSDATESSLRAMIAGINLLG